MSRVHSLVSEYAGHLAALRADFPRPLAQPNPVPATRGLSWHWYVALVALCFVPRLLMAWKIADLCPDAILYINLASALERGDWSAGLEQMRLNVFPVVLMFLHRLGLDWQFAGEAWNVCLASAAVIPLLSWVQRMFDGRTALIAGLLYAAHPALIERSPEVIRDPTFWFAMLWTLDASWRAVTRVRLRDFLLAGTALSLAVLTRFEGLFLYLPLVVWSAMRLQALATAKVRLVTGVALAVGFLPISLLVVQQACLPGVNPLSLVRIEPLTRVFVVSDTGAAITVAKATDVQVATPLKLLPKYLQSVSRGIDPVMLVLIGLGIFGWGAMWRRPEHWPLHALACLFLLGGWFHLWHSQAISCRYSLPVFLVASPWGALGLAWPASKLGTLPRAFQQLRTRAIATSAALVIIVVVGSVDALTTRLGGRDELKRISHDITTQLGTNATVFTLNEAAVQVNFYAGIQCVSIDSNIDLASIVTNADQSRPIAILLDRKHGDFRHSLHVASDVLGMKQISPAPDAARKSGHWLLFARPSRQVRSATSAQTL